jgi:rhodanese-related sulfurtransferase
MLAFVKRLNVSEFEKILKGTDRSKYQIVDVREKDELQTVRIADNDIINLPLRSADSWTQKVINGELLDSEKPTLCLCHHGVRSMKVATFLSELLFFFKLIIFKNLRLFSATQAEFADVYNIDGGINAYAEQVDPSIGFY